MIKTFSSESDLATFAESFGRDLLVRLADSIKKSPAPTSDNNAIAPASDNSTPTPGNQAPIVLELVGDVGAGKTTFTRALAKGLGVTAPVTSPSFSISNRYSFKDGSLIHYDFYRLEDPGIMSAELAEALSEPNTVIVLEWSDSVKNLLPDSRTVITFKITEETERELEIK